MPDSRFYNELRSKYNQQYPREFWDWLLQQNIQKPWWSIFGDPALRNYLDQLYRQFAPPTPSRPITYGGKTYTPQEWKEQVSPTIPEALKGMPLPAGYGLTGVKGLPSGGKEYIYGAPPQVPTTPPLTIPEEGTFTYEGQTYPMSALSAILSYDTNKRQLDESRRQAEKGYMQEALENIVAQLGYLPMGKGGTGVEQIIQAQKGRVELGRRLQLTAPDYLKPLIQSQMQELEDFIKAQKETETIKASSLQQPLTPENIQGIYSEYGAEEALVKIWGKLGNRGNFYQWLESEEGQAYQKLYGISFAGSAGARLARERKEFEAEYPIIPEWMTALGVPGGTRRYTGQRPGIPSTTLGGATGQEPGQFAGMPSPAPGLASAQFYSRVTPTQRQDLSDYLKYIGGSSILDYEQLVAQMLPRPSVGARWQAARSMA